MLFKPSLSTAWTSLSIEKDKDRVRIWGQIVTVTGILRHTFAYLRIPSPDWCKLKRKAARAHIELLGPRNASKGEKEGALGSYFIDYHSIAQARPQLQTPISQF